MKKFTVTCVFGDQKAPFTIYIGQPKDGNHPVHFQAEWLAKQRGGNIPGEIMENLQKLLELSIKNGVSFEELAAYAINNSIVVDETMN